MTGSANFSISNEVRTNIRRHDDNRVFHIDNSSLAVSHLSFIENLEKNIPYIGMSFFDFVQEHN